MKSRMLALGALAAMAVASTAAPALSQTVLKLGHVLAPTHQFHQGMELAAKAVAERTQGRVRIQVFPSSQLGTERDMHVAVRTGSVDMLLASPGGASVHLKEVAVLDAPFLFRDDPHWKAVVYGPMGEDWAQKMAKASGVQIVGWFHRGTRHVISKDKPYDTIGAMRNQKIRVADLPPYPQVFRALGAVPTPIAFAEMYSALQAGVVDGADVPLDTIQSQKLYEVSKYANLIAWSYAAPGLIVMSDQAFQKVSAEDRQVLKVALREGSDFIADAFVKGEEQVKKDIQKAGMTLVEPKDPAAWRQAAEKAIPELASTWGGDVALYNRIRDYK
jgi:TRAP-type transport system periplasmic protein